MDQAQAPASGGAEKMAAASSPTDAEIEPHKPPTTTVFAPKERLEFTEPNFLEKERYPARYLGYRVFSKWVASDQNLLVVRKFASLNVRIILSLQDEIVKLEQDLNGIDEDSSRPGPIDDCDPEVIHNGTFREDHVKQRTELLEILAKKLQRYSELISFKLERKGSMLRI
jgi:hypothetical protein